MKTEKRALIYLTQYGVLAICVTIRYIDSAMEGAMKPYELRWLRECEEIVKMVVRREALGLKALRHASDSECCPVPATETPHDVPRPADGLP
jgi:hypothetical protein